MRGTHVASSVVDVLRVATDGGARELHINAQPGADAVHRKTQPRTQDAQAQTVEKGERQQRQSEVSAGPRIVHSLVIEKKIRPMALCAGSQPCYGEENTLTATRLLFSFLPRCTLSATGAAKYLFHRGHSPRCSLRSRACWRNAPPRSALRTHKSRGLRASLARADNESRRQTRPAHVPVHS